MKSKISKILGAALMLMAVALFSSCEEKIEVDEDALLGKIEVTLAAPEGTINYQFLGSSLTLTNIIDGAEHNLQTDKNGKAVFEKLTAGTYNLSVVGSNTTGSLNNIPVSSGNTTAVTIPLTKVNASKGLVIKEVFYSGHSFDYDLYAACGFKDYFVEIFNNSNDTLYLDNLHIAEAWNQTAMTSATSAVTPILEDKSLDHNYIYSQMIVKIPGSGKEHPLLPGKSFLLATNAMNFKEEVKNMHEMMGEEADPENLKHIIDLTCADMETYAVDFMEAQGAEGEPDFDFDNPAVPNAENVYFEAKLNRHFALEYTGSSIILFKPAKELDKSNIIKYSYKTKDESDLKNISLMKIDAKEIIDGCDAVYDAQNSCWKRLTKMIDAGFIYVPDEMEYGGSTNYSVRRKLDAKMSNANGRCYLMDTNNSSNDFEAVEIPTPKAGYAGYDIR